MAVVDGQDEPGSGVASSLCLVATAAVTVPGDDSSWVEPDYMSIPPYAELPDDEAERRLIWPGPAMLMPADLLPDGQPHSHSDMDNAERITGRRPRNATEADAVVLAYVRQQSALRAAAGLAPARRDTSGHLVETPGAIGSIRELHRRERARRRLFETPPEIGEFLDRLAGIAVDAAETTLSVHGLCPPPTVHMVCADIDPPYAGMLTCRPFYRGVDAADAIAAMGALPSALLATHLVVVWEHCDLCTALELPGESFPSGVVVLVATRSEHTVRWYPYVTRFGPVGTSGMPTVLPDWEPPRRYPGAALPQPVARLLESWRTRPAPDELEQQAVRLERAGYRIRWAARS